MKIGIQISSDLEKKTGVEEYVYQLLKHLTMVDDFRSHQFFLFTPFSSSGTRNFAGYNRRSLKWPLKKGWTQIRLSLAMLKNRPDVLFIPVHTFPLIHPKLVVTIHGLEYENVPETYSFLQRKILRYSTKRNIKKAEKTIVPSECTKQDLIKFYKIAPEKITVIHHGISKPKIKDTRYKIQKNKYILYLGSEHKRKNIRGLIEVFRILKTKYLIPHQLMLVGLQISNSQFLISNQIPNPNFQKDIILKNYVSEEEKWQLLKNAEVFVFPSFYEGFGFPVLEAQSVGVPVVASNVSSLPEILGESALLINPNKPEEIAEAVYKIIKNPEIKKNLIEKGYKNVNRFDWKECARKTASVIINL